MSKDYVGEMPIRNSMFLARLATLIEAHLEDEKSDKEHLKKKFQEFVDYYETGTHPSRKDKDNE
jgi:hypothetical protein